ncbi:MAG: right-handed parallel beta-helix repeat-containing protein [Desulfatibacillum sp.]|nr:right-handed parallel beta-helix repeat-containing protein [Desulfatibacillum sp.]
MKKSLLILTFLLSIILVFSGCSDDDDDGTVKKNNNGAVTLAPIVVNSLTDAALTRKAGMTLRAALNTAASNQPIVFHPSLDGGVIQLTIVGDGHTILKGEVMGMREEESGPVSYLEGYFDRDYGKSALYARKNVILDASQLPNGITLEWAGVEDARVLAVYGDLTMNNVAVTGGRSVAEDISGGDVDAEQPWTLGRGGGVAVWGVASLKDCTLYGNYCEGDFGREARDRGAFGGGVYTDIVHLQDCIVSGNSIYGSGAAGGGVFSVTGAESKETVSTIERCSITGNHLSAAMTYGGGVYSDGGSIGNSKELRLTNCTIARNLADASGIQPFLLGMGYWRGGGVYISNGSLTLKSCTIVENEVHGLPRTDSLGKSNMAGGVAATIGNAHAVDDMKIEHCIIAGNTVHETGGTIYDHDVFTGTVFYFRSRGYNRLGVVDFSQILVPVGERNWASLCRKHFPKTGDASGVLLDDVLDMVAGPVLHASILSTGVDAGNPVPLYYEPRGQALDQFPAPQYYIQEVFAEYWVDQDTEDNFLEFFLARLEDYYNLEGFAAGFTEDFETFLSTVDADDKTDGVQHYTDPDGNPILTLADTLWFGPADTWPKEVSNYPYIHFWHRLDAALADENIPGMGPEILGDNAWAALFDSGEQAESPNITMRIWSISGYKSIMENLDQLGLARPVNDRGDIGAIELP